MGEQVFYVKPEADQFFSRRLLEEACRNDKITIFRTLYTAAFGKNCNPQPVIVRMRVTHVDEITIFGERRLWWSGYLEYTDETGQEWQAAFTAQGPKRIPVMPGTHFGMIWYRPLRKEGE